MDKLLKELVETPGICGHEELVRDKIISELPKGISYQIDPMGNLLLSIGEGEELFLTAHMDEIGMVVTHVEENGYLRVRKVGGLDPRVLMGQQVTVMGSKGKLPAAVAITPPHLLDDPKMRNRVIPFDEIFLDIGASSAAEAQEMGVESLSPVVPFKNLVTLNKRFLMGRSLDDRLGCWVLLEILKKFSQQSDLPCKITFAWTVQEEIGLRGAHALLHTVRPKYIVALDTISAGDIPESCLHKSNNSLGKGPVLRMVDSRGMASSWMKQQILEIAKANNIAVQVGTSGGSTDGAALQLMNVHVIPLCFPTRYTHSHCEMVCWDDVMGMQKLVELLPNHLAKISG